MLHGLLARLLWLPNRRCVVHSDLWLLVPPGGSETITVHPAFWLVMLANLDLCGTQAFLSLNVLDSLGLLCNTIVMDLPLAESMATVLHCYSKCPTSSSSVEVLVQAFVELFWLNLEGELSYLYGLGKAVSLVKDLNINDDLSSTLLTTFDHEVDPMVQHKILVVLTEHGLVLDCKAFAVALGMSVEHVQLQVEDTVPCESEQDPKHGCMSDKKEHMGSNTWEGGTGSSSMAGLGGWHRLYWLDLGQSDMHQVAEEDKMWTDLN